MQKRIFSLVLFVLFSGCASKPNSSAHYTNAYSYDGLNRETTLFIAPIMSTFKDLDKGEKIVLEEIAQQLDSAGWKIVTMGKTNYSDLFDWHAESIGGLYSWATGEIDVDKFEYVLAKVAESISQSGDYEAIVIPTITLRTAELKGRYAFWDGVKRKKITDHRYSNMSWSGNTRGLSIELSTYSPEGYWLFTSYGGLTLPYHTIRKDGKDVNAKRENIFDNESDIRSGVNVALTPILNPPAAQPLACQNHIQKTINLREAGQYTEALQELTYHYSCDPDDIGMMHFYHKGWVYHELGEYKNSIESYSKGLETQPDYLYAYWRRGLSFEELGQIDKAEEDYRTAYKMGLDQFGEKFFFVILDDNPEVKEKILKE